MLNVKIINKFKIKLYLIIFEKICIGEQFIYIYI